MNLMKLPLLVAVLALPLLGCGRNPYGYEIINDSPDRLTAVRVLDPNFSFPDIEMEPYRGGLTINNEGRTPKSVEVRWTRSGKAPKSVQVDTGLDCPGRPSARLMTVQYWIRADDSIRTRFEMDDPSRGYVDFVPCESDAEKARRLANDELEAAATAGDVSRIEAALKRAPVNPEGYFDPAPLHLATAAGHLAAVQYLLEHGARIEVPQRYTSQSALVIAILEGQPQISDLLINSGADLNSVSSNNSPLLAASEKGWADVVKQLLDRGADINLQALGESALISAARAGKAGVVALLLERGADPNTTIGGTSITALDIAEQFRHSDVATLLISRGAKHGPPR